MPRTDLSKGLKVACWLEFIDTVGLGFAISATLGHWAFPATTPHTDAVDDDAWVGLLTLRFINAYVL